MTNNVTRLTNSGNLLVNGTFDEFTGAPVVDGNTLIWLDAAQTASYPGTGTSWTSLTSQANVATLSSTTFSSLTSGGSLYFNGVDSTAQITPPDNLGNCSIATVELWANIKVLGSRMPFGFNRYDVYLTSGGVGYNTGNSDSYGISAADTANLGIVGNWRHYCFVMYNNTSRTVNPYTNNKIYVNGVQQTLTQLAGLQGNTTKTLTGNLVLSGWANDSSYKAEMDVGAVKVYDRELTQAEVLQNYNALAGRYGLTANASGTAIQRTNSTTVLAEQFDEVTYNTASPTIKNFLTYSQNFTISWNGSNPGNSAAYITTNAIASPTGDNTGQKLYSAPAAVGSAIQRVYKFLQFTAGQTYTFSVYAKAAEFSKFWSFVEPASGRIGISVDLIASTVSIYSGTPTNMFLTSVGNGWYRTGFTWTAPATENVPMNVMRLINNSSQATFVGDGISGVYLWGSQVELANTATIYQPIAAANTLVTTGMTQRVDSGGNMYVSNIFDEFTGAPVVDSSLVLWIDPGQTASYSGSGTVVNDLSGTTNNLTLVNSPTFSSVNGGGSFLLNGTDQYGTIGYTASLAPTAGLTVACWASLPNWNITGVANDRRMISKTEGGGYNLAINDTSTYYGYVTGAVNVSGTYYNPKYELSNMAAGWHQVVVTCDGRYTILYVDGIARETLDRGSVGTLTYIYNNSFMYGTEASAGSSPVPNRYWPGTLGPAMVYNRALTADEVANNYDALKRRYGLT